MKIFGQYLKTSMLGVLLAGCATQPSVDQSLVAPAARVELIGFSVLAPPGKNWSPGADPFGGIVYKKQLSGLSGNPDLHSYLVGVSRRDVEDELSSTENLLALFNRNLSKNEPHLQLVSSNAVLDEVRSDQMGAGCIRYDMVLRERDNPYTPEVIYNLTVRGFQCRHPSSSQVVIDVFCSERYPHNSQPVGEMYSHECAAFQDSVHLNPLQAIEDSADSNIPIWDYLRWQKIVSAAQFAYGQNDKNRAELMCQTALHYVDVNAIRALYEYADLLMEQKPEYAVTVRSRADRLRENRIQKLQATRPVNTYLGFVPWEVLNEYAVLLDELLRDADVVSIRGLSHAYQFSQEVHIVRYRMILTQEGDPRGLCIGFGNRAN